MRRLLSIYLLISLFYQAHSVAIKNPAKREICSNGACNTCDGRSCNGCNDNVCCSTASCNNCVSQCANECSTTRCKNNCVSGCTSSCQTPSCQVQSCSQCVNKCSNDCSTKSCVTNCANKCDSCAEKVIEKVKEHDDSVVIIPSQEPSNVIVNNTNNNLVNLTTHININNVIHNINNISIPVVVNSTNINNINLSSDITDSHSQPSVYGNQTVVRTEIVTVPYPWYIQPYQQPIINQPNSCCYVLHPKQCYADEGGERCFIRRSRECSSSCTSPVVTIEEDPTAINRGCQSVRSWPYTYCGNYVRGNCNECYSCGGEYNPSQCFKQSGCSETCRRSAPNCVPSQSGLQCY